MLTEQQQAFLKVLDLVEEAGCIDHVVLVGSWRNLPIEKLKFCMTFAQILRRWMSTFLSETYDAPTQRRA